MTAKRVIIKIKTVIAIFTVILIATALLSLSSCDKGAGISDKYTKSPFQIEIEGETDGKVVSARVYVDPTAHLTKEIYPKMIITFSYPQNLDGITVTYLSNGKSLVRYGELISEELSSPNGISELFDIFVPGKEFTRVKKAPSGKTVAEYESGQGKISYVFDENDRLTEISGEQNRRFFHFDVKVVENKY